ncbi:hypothetical protein CK516_05165 [Nostoc sp. 'Peltigera malacea cyanobiont' DB3992]|nr:hypothetical protein CK516_05165 [Nostoc sp. 'Peltigera malacea cyanobiont' DB3992]
MKNCPCCSHWLLRHISNNQVYWFCRSCWLEMPLVKLESSTQEKAESLIKFIKFEKKEVVQAQIVRVKFSYQSSSNIKHS